MTDPNECVVKSDAGEGYCKILDKLIGQLIIDYRLKQLIQNTPSPISAEKYKLA
ncbi:MAG: hypothetical protein HBSAPP01_24230 [Candidatus Brocadia sapporoensis]|uniref:hypothetical protein n=1 Tax=Candidatus Brocadia sapporoensis TaxID=392547 RepID=UPI0015C42C3C|nr:hypothetical protein [Candidatus Brocadia sapporoensis]GJQ24633.1 MAG: hypothetical protein HBSAPP01_24230 [Candidatus Brocadia sapporoensis]